MSALRTEIVSDAGRLAALQPDWRDLWRRCPEATPFQSPAWLLPWWHAFSPGPLRTVAVWRGRRLAGLAPFYLEQGASGSRLLPLGISLSDYLDVLIDPADRDDAAADLAAGLSGLGSVRCELEELRGDAAAWALPCPASLEDETQPQSACPVVALAGGDDLAGCVPARRRRQLRRARAAAERRGGLLIEPAEDADAFLKELFRLHAARWKERGKRGLLDDPAVRAFHREALPGLLACGLARCWLLRIGDAVAGAYYGLADERRAYAYLGGFDPASAEESPGSILIGHAISAAIREGLGEFHFLRGREAYKYSWGAVDRWNRRRSLVRRQAA